MKQSRATIFAISALVLLLSLVQGSPLSAQTQSQTQSADCPLEGPSVAETLKYINDALPYSDRSSEQAQFFQLGMQDNVLTVKIRGTIGNTLFRYSAPVNALRCQLLSGSMKGPTFMLSVPCVDGDCVSDSTQTYDGVWASPTYMHLFYVQFSVDNDRGQRLVRAFSHLIALSQQQYKQSHSNPTDPFAKPQ